MGWLFEVLELISKRQKDIGTKCSWDIWLLGQNVVGTFGIWDNSLFFGTDMHWDKRHWDKMSLGQFTCGQKGFGTILLGKKGIGTKGIGKITKGQSPWVYLQCTGKKCRRDSLLSILFHSIRLCNAARFYKSKYNINKQTMIITVSHLPRMARLR